MATPLYNRGILRLAADIPHLGRLDAADGRADFASRTCGSRVAVDVAIDAAGRVAVLGQEVSACALGQASAALMGAHAIGRSAAELAAARNSLAQYLDGDRDDPGAWPGLAILAAARPYTARHQSIILPFAAAAEAARRAVEGRAEKLQDPAPSGVSSER